MTTNAFEMTATFETLQPRGKVLCSGIVMRTFPNYYIFDYIYNKAIHDKGRIVFIDCFGHPSVYLSVFQITQGVFQVNYIDYTPGEECYAHGAKIKQITYKAERFGTLEAKEP